MEKQQKQQQNNNNLIIKNLKRKALPVELIVNIFNIASDISLNDLNIIICQKICNKIKDKKIEEDQLKKYWHKFAKNILMASKMVNFFVGDKLKKKKFLMDKDDPAKSKFNDQFDKYLDEISRIREEEDKEEKRKILKILEKHFERQNKTINTFCSEMTTSNALVLNQLKSVINKEEDVTDAVEESKPGTSGTSSVSDTGPTISDTDISPERKKFRPAIGSPRKVWYCNPCRKSINIKSRASHLISATHIRLSTLLQNVTSSSKTDKQQSPKKD